MHVILRTAFALASIGAAALLVAACGDDISGVCGEYCKCNSCSGEECQLQTKQARENAIAMGCGTAFDAYLLCTKANYDCGAAFFGAGACKAEAQAALDCGITEGIGQRACEGKAHFIDSLVSGCAQVSETGTFAPSACDPVPAAVVDCRLACALQYDCSNSLEVCLDGCPSMIQ